MVFKRKTLKFLKRKSTWFVLLLLVIIIVSLYIFRHHSNKATIPSTHAVVNNQGTNQNNSVSGNPSSSSTTSNPKSTTSGSSPTNTDNTLIAPYGSFVSNHHPGSSDQELSVCTTSPGATCYIQFTNGQSVKKLDSQTVSGDGTAYWSWNIKTLSPGTWTISAVASFGSQIKTTNDQLTLEVQP